MDYSAVILVLGAFFRMEFNYFKNIEIQRLLWRCFTIVCLSTVYRNISVIFIFITHVNSLVGILSFLE